LAGDSAVVIATRYGLHGLGIEALWGQDFPHPSRLALGLTQPPVQWIAGPFPAGKTAGCGVDHPSTYSADCKERVQLYVYFPSGSSRPAVTVTFLLPVTLYVI